MIRKSKHLEALMRAHWRELARGERGIWLDCYNCSIKKRVCGAITTRVDHCNHYFLTERR